MAHQVFICYASRDKAIADAVCAALESRHIKCWIAPRDVLAGADWAEIIVDAIDGSPVLVLVLSSSSNSSPQVIREVGRAASNGIPIIPLRIDDVTPSKAMDFFISRHQFLDALTPPLKKHLPRLADTVQRILTRKGAPQKVIEIAEAEEKARWEAAKVVQKVSHCPKCGVELRPKASFCHKCGIPLSKSEKAKEVEERAKKEEEARKAKEAEERARREAEEARRAKEVEERAKKEEEARKAKEAEERARREAELAAKEREHREAEETGRAKEAEEKVRREAAKAAQQVSYCPKCGIELRAKASFCHKCGTLVSKSEKAK